MRSITLLVTFVSLATLSLAGQASREKLSSVENQDVNAFVESFKADISKTRDLTRYLTTPIAKRILNTVFQDGETLAPELLARTAPEDLQRFYVAMTNLSYLSQLYVYTRVELKNGGLREVPPERQYPRPVYQSLVRNDTLTAWWRHDSSQEPIKTTDQLRELTQSFERAAGMMRRDFAKHRPESSTMYRKNVSWLKTRLHPIKVTQCDSSASCEGFPMQAQFIDVELPVLTLYLVRINGKVQLRMVGIPEGLW